MKTVKRNFTLGKMRSGRSFDLPWQLKESDVERFLRHFTNQELIDVLCLSEEFLAISAREEKQGPLVVAATFIVKTLLTKRKEPEFEWLLTRLGLCNSISYVRFAKTRLR